MKLRLALLVLALTASPALAHVGHDATFTAGTGFGHPFSGLDHLTAMIAVGLWSAIGGGRRIWIWPLAFVTTMMVSALAAHAGLHLPLVEPAIAASVLVLGLLIAAAVDAPVPLGTAVVAAFAIAHGYAHGAEAPAQDFAGYTVGFATATALLHLFGIGAGTALQRLAGAVPVRMLGGATAALGLVMLVR